MAERTEVEDRVDLDEDNYMEETEYDAEEDQEEDPEEDAGDAQGEEIAEDDDEDSKEEGGQKDQSSDVNKNIESGESSEVEQKPSSSVSEADKEKHAHLLSLPPHGSEVFVGGLPKNVVEEDLRDLCEPIGDVFEIRMVKDKDTGESKGFAFVAFKSKEDAQRAIEELQSKEFKGKTLRCSLSETKNRLFIGNLPKSWTEEEFRKVIEEVGPGVDIIELIKDPLNPMRNRGFAFVLYYNNACADYSRQKMASANFKLDGNNPTVSWADPKSAPSEQSSASSQVKALYVKNIPENTPTEKVKELFQRHGEVTKVVMPPGKAGKRDFGFIHFTERSSALKAVKDTEKYEIDGQVLEVVLAKPQTDRKLDAAYPYNVGGPPAHAAYPAYGGYAGAPYGGSSAGFGVPGSFHQPVIYGRGPMPSGMQMVPMVLPDGRIGYVLQQPGVQMPQPRPRRVDRNNGPGGSGRAGSSSDDSYRSKRHRPY